MSQVTDANESRRMSQKASAPSSGYICTYIQIYIYSYIYIYIYTHTHILRRSHCSLTKKKGSCEVTLSYLWFDVFISMTRLLVGHIQGWISRFVSFIHIFKFDAFSVVCSCTWLSHMCHQAHSCTWLIHMCDMIHSFFMCNTAPFESPGTVILENAT